jgi:hypothetical protein
MKVTWDHSNQKDNMSKTTFKIGMLLFGTYNHKVSGFSMVYDLGFTTIRYCKCAACSL